MEKKVEFSDVHLQLKNQLTDMLAQICKNLEFIKSSIDTNPEDAKKLIDSMISTILQEMKGKV